MLVHICTCMCVVILFNVMCVLCVVCLVRSVPVCLSGKSVDLHVVPGGNSTLGAG